MAQQWEGLLEGAAQELKGHLTLERVTASKAGDEIAVFFSSDMLVEEKPFLAAQRAIEEAQAVQPDVILCVGQAGGRAAVTPEMVAINLRYAAIPDNAGLQPQDIPCAEDGPAAYFATVPVREMARAIAQAGLPGSVSYTAGTFVCNDLLYTLLHHYHDTAVRVGFIHVPFLPGQAGQGQPSMALDDIVRALCAAIEAL